MWVFNKRWTNLSKPPKEIIDDACLYLSDALSDTGFRLVKSKRLLVRKDENSDFQFRLNLGTNSRNQRNARVYFNIHFEVYSDRIKKWRQEFYAVRSLGEPTALVTNRAIGYLTPQSKFQYGTWNLLETHPEKIIKVLTQSVIPRFGKFENPVEFIQEMRNGKPEEFCFDFEVLDFLMCYGGDQYASECLTKMLVERGWVDEFNRKQDQWRTEGAIDDRQSLINLLVHRSDYFEIPISP